MPFVEMKTGLLTDQVHLDTGLAHHESDASAEHDVMPEQTVLGFSELGT